MRSAIRTTRVLGYCFGAVVLLACATVSHADIEVVKLRLEGKSRISATESEYSYRVEARNNGGAAAGVTAEVRSYSGLVTVVDGHLDFADMGTGQIASSDNLFVIRKATKVRFPRHLIRVDFTATATPVADAGPDQLGTVGEDSILNARRSYDPFGRPLRYEWTLDSAPGGSAATLDDATSLAPTFEPDVAGDYVFRLVVNNGVHDSAASTTTISTVAARPFANAGRSRTVKRKSAVRLDGSASTNPMERPLVYAWQLLSVPVGSAAILSDAAALRPTFVADKKGDYRVQLIVTDGALSSAPSIVTIRRGTKKTNTRPLAEAGPDISSFGVGLPVVLQAGLTVDDDADFLTYRWSVLSSPAGSLASPTFNDPNPIFRPDAAGLWHLQVNVSDGKSESIATVLLNTSLEVAPVPNADVMAGTPDPALFQFSSNPFTAYVDPNGTYPAPTASWTVLSRPAGSVAGLATPSAEDTAFPADIDGDYAVQVRVADPGSTDSLQSVGVTRGSSVPVAVVDRLHFVDWREDLPVTLDASESWDPQGLPITYEWKIVHRPSGSVTELINPTLPWATMLLDVEGSYVVQLVVSNGVAKSLPVSKTLVSFYNERPIAIDSLVSGPWQSPCIPIELTADDAESNHGIAVGVLHRVVHSTTNGILLNFLAEDTDGRSTLCYRPRRFYFGPDQFTWESIDFGFPWGCGPPGPGCFGPTKSTIGTVIISVAQI